MVPYELTYYYSLVCLVPMYAQVKFYKQDILAVPSHLYLTIGNRLLFGVLTDVFLYLSFAYTSYSKGMCIFFLNTIMIPFIASFILKESVKKSDIVAILISFAGMLIIINPFNNSAAGNRTSFKNDIIGILLAFVGAFVSALAVVLNKRLADSLHFSLVNIYYQASCCLLNPLLLFFQQRAIFPLYSWSLLGHIVAISLSFWLMMVLMTKSIKMLSAGVSGILLYVAVPTSYLLDYFFLGTRIGIMEIIGACVIVGTNVTIGVLIIGRCIK